MPRRRRRTWDFEEEEPREAPSRTPPTVDLHGLTVEGAERRLVAELCRLRAGGVRAVRVVTGAGHGSHAGKARLLPAMDRWLRSPAARERAGVVSVARVRGLGALDVRLGR